MNIFGLIKNKIRAQIWAAFGVLIILFLLASYKTYSDFVKLGNIASVINELDRIAVSVQLMAHDNNAYLLGHAEHAEEFEKHAARLVIHWNNVKDYHKKTGNFYAGERPLYEMIDLTIKSYISNSQKLFTTFRESEKHRQHMIDQVRQLGEFLAGDSATVTSAIMRESMLLLAVFSDMDKVGQAALPKVVKQRFDEVMARLNTLISEQAADEAALVFLSTLAESAGKRQATLKILDAAWLAADQGSDLIDTAAGKSVALHLTEITEFKKSVSNDVIVVTMLLILLSALLAQQVGRAISKPVGNLVDAARKFESGDLMHRASVDSSNELGVVGTAFNSMADHVQKFNQKLKKEVEERTSELADSRDRTEAIMSRIIDGIVVCNEDGKIESANVAAKRVFRALDTGVTGQPLDTLLTSAGTIESDIHIDPKALAQSAKFAEFQHHGNDGRTTWIETAATALHIGDEQVLIVIFRDITERIDAQNSLETARDVAEKANNAKSEFLSSMSHELRTPMNAIIGFGQMLEFGEEEPLTELQKTCVNHIMDGGNHLLELIDQILDLAKIETGTITLSMEKIELGEVLDECLTLVGKMAADRNLSIENNLAAPCMISADYTRIKQVALNLLSNAIKYNREGGEIILSSTDRPGGRVRISVTDTGEGIAKEVQDGLFEPFNRLGKEAGEIEGTGIGLTITRQITEAMGGVVGFESEVGTGSTFWVEFPGMLNTTPVLAANSGVSEKASSEQAPDGVTILYIEDNPANRQLMETIFNRMDGLSLIPAASAELGLSIAEERQPDLILMDINLPGMNGLEALHELGKIDKTRDIPVIAISARAMKKDIEQGLAAGFKAYLTKPFNVPKLIEVIEKELASSQQEPGRMRSAQNH